MEPGILEEKSECEVRKEETSVISVQHSKLLRERTKLLVARSISSGYGSGEDDDLNIIFDGNDFSMLSGTNGFGDAVPQCTKVLNPGEQSTVGPNDEPKFSTNSEENKPEISVREQSLSNVELFEYPEWSSEVADVKEDIDRDHSRVKVFSGIPTSDLRKLDNVTLEFDTNISKLSEENLDSGDAHSEYTEDVRTLCAGLDSDPLGINKLMDENYDELEKKIHCHKISMEKIVADILKMTKEAEDSIQGDTEKLLVAAFDEVLEFHQEVKSPDDSLLKDSFPEKNICDSDECPNGVRKPCERPSEFLNNVNSSVQFFHGFCTGYQATSSHRFVPQKSHVANLGAYCSGEWSSSTEYPVPEHNFYPWMAPYDYLSTEHNSSDLKAESCGSNAQNSEQKFPSWLNEEPSFLAGTRSRPSPEIKDEKLLEASFRNSSSCSSDLMASFSPVEDFFNSLYLPEDLLPSEITSSATAQKRRDSVDSFLSDDRVSAARSSSSDDRVSAARSSSSDDRVSAARSSSSDDRDSAARSMTSEFSLSTRSRNNYAERVDTGENYKDFWGDEKETFWKPLPACQATNGQRLNRTDNLRINRGGRKVRSIPFSTTRHAPKPRAWSGGPHPRK